MRVRRIDIGQLAKPVKRADGTMVVQAKLARTGVQMYRNDDGSPRREYRPRTQVADQRSVDSFKLVPFTNNHPPEMVTADNAKQYMAGAVGQDVHMDGDWLVGTIAVFDAATVRDLESGKTEVSNGYDCDLDMTPGVSPDGEHYDAIQMNITGNHVALVWNARAGHEAAIRMDAAAMEPITHKETTMDLAQALAALAAAQEKLGAANSRADVAERERDALKTRKNALDTELATAKELAVKAESARKDIADGRDAFVSARVALLTAVAPVLRTDAGEPMNCMKMSDREIKLALIKHVTDSDCDTNPKTGKKASDDYVDARYDAAIEQASNSADTFRATNDHIEGLRSEGTSRKDVDSAYDAMVKANRAAGQPVASK